MTCYKRNQNQLIETSLHTHAATKFDRTSWNIGSLHSVLSARESMQRLYIDLLIVQNSHVEATGQV
jgi:hypothetical protein